MDEIVEMPVVMKGEDVRISAQEDKKVVTDLEL